MVKPRCLIWGDQDKASWHPLAGVRLLLETILGQDFDIHVRDDGCLEPTDMQGMSLVLNYRDQWETPPDPSQADLLLSFLASGGGLLSLHNGICLARESRFRPLLGGIFTGHPEPALLEFTVTPPLETIAAPGNLHCTELGSPLPGADTFTLWEEPYRFDFPPECKADIFLRYQHGGMSCPAGWSVPPGRSCPGRSAYLAPGHDATIFASPAYAGLIRKTAVWCTSATTA